MELFDFFRKENEKNIQHNDEKNVKEVLKSDFDEDIQINDLDKFGEVFIKEARDYSIRNINKMIDGTMKGETAKKVLDKISNLTNEQKDILKDILSLTVDETLANFLWMIENSDEIKLMYNDTDLNEESDGLSGELYTKDGWIKKYSDFI